MEIEITEFFYKSTPRQYFASVAEVGPDAGPNTWRAACSDSAEYMLLNSPEKLAAAREYFAGFGAWSREELAAMPDTEVNALLLQYIAGDMREFCEDPTEWDWKEYQDASCRGVISGNLFEDTEGHVYIYLGF